MYRILSKVILFFSLLFFAAACLPSDQHLRSASYSLGMPREDHLVRVAIDDNFSLLQRVQIQRAFDTWERISGYKLQFKLNWNSPKPGRYFQFAKPKEDAGIFFWDLPKTAYHISQEQMEEWKTYYGVMVYGEGENSGNVIVFEEVDDWKFYSVALHEVGHLIGLKHIDIWSVMHPTAIAECVTTLDAQQLCDLYRCNPMPECDQNGNPL